MVGIIDRAIYVPVMLRTLSPGNADEYCQINSKAGMEGVVA
jgi:hypothetical protein